MSPATSAAARSAMTSACRSQRRLLVGASRVFFRATKDVLVLEHSRRGASCHYVKSPDGNLGLQVEVKAVLDAALDQVDEPQDVASAGAGLGDEPVGVAVADLDIADLGADQGRLLDQGGRVEAGGVLEDPARRLEA